PDRRERRRRALGRDEQDLGGERQLRLQRSDRAVRRYGGNGRSRSDKSEPYRAAKRGFRSRALAHYRGDGGRTGRRKEERRWPRPRHGRNGWNGRDGYVGRAWRTAPCTVIQRLL